LLLPTFPSSLYTTWNSLILQGLLKILILISYIVKTVLWRIQNLNWLILFLAYKKWFFSQSARILKFIYKWFTLVFMTEIFINLLSNHLFKFSLIRYSKLLLINMLHYLLKIIWYSVYLFLFFISLYCLSRSWIYWFTK